MASFWTYKPTQGYWTRTLSFIGAMALVAATAGWLWNELKTAGVYAQGTVAAVLVVGALFFFWRIFNRPKIGEFMIATESEMNKVAWPSRKEVISSTWLVIAGTFLFALVLFLIDIAFTYLFQSIGVLKTAT